MRSTTGTADPKAKGLSPKQMAFCAEYIVDLNATQAAMRAGYSKKTARAQASRLLLNVNIGNEVARLSADRSKRVEVTADTILSELLKLAMTDIGQAFEEDGSLKAIHDMPEDIRRAIAGVDVFEEFEGRGDNREQIGWTKKIRFWDKTKCLEMLGRHLRLFADRLEHSGPDGGPIRTGPAMSLETEKEIADCMEEVRKNLRIPEGLKPLGS